MRAFVLVGVAACFQAGAQTGAPCDNAADEPCPPSQTCVAGRCMSTDDLAAGPDGAASTSMIDGAVMPLPGDRDGDGVTDDVDNCPDVPNPDQANEDGDKFGDVCDPCPVEANDHPSDPDGDGVADGCDPNPSTPGDKIALFEGFDRSNAELAAAGWQLIGNVQAGSGQVALVDVANNYAAIVPPNSGLANATVSASIVVDQQVGSADSATTLALPYDPAGDQGIFCELYAPLASSSAGRYISLWDSTRALERGSAALAWTPGTPYRVALKKLKDAYTCTVATATATGASGVAVASGDVAFATYGASAHALWLMIVTSP
jgi:hypothetical protein